MRAAIYARYSSDNQREESIDAQIRAIKEFASLNDYTIVKIYTDEALTAKTDNRPQFLQMISDAKQGMFDVLICHKLDRFARNRYDSAFYKKTLKDNGVRLISVLENFDDSPESIILESVLEGMAEYYSANLAREVMKGMKENALDCKHTGGKPAFGFDVGVDKKYVLNDREAIAVQRIFSMVCNGCTFSDIRTWLESNNYKTKYHTSFTSGAINAIIRNEKYKGVYVYGKSKRIVENGIKKDIEGDDVIRIPDGVPRIVTDEMWETANDIYDQRQYRSGGQAKAKECYLLSGLIYCGLCGGSMCGNRVHSGRSKSLRITYKCNTRKAKHECNAKDIRKDLVESIVIDELQRQLSEPGIDMIVNALMNQLKTLAKGAPDEIKDLNRKLNGVELKINNIINAIMNGMNTPSMKDAMNQLETEKSDLVDRIEYMHKQQEQANIPTKEMLHDYLAKDMNIKNKGPDDQKRIIKTYVKKVLVYPEYIEIYSEVDTNSGAEGNRTPVRKPIHCSISHYS